MRKNLPYVRVLLSYADAEQNHVGTIYQATNWIYQGFGIGTPPGNYTVKEYKGGLWMHARSVSDRWGAVNIEILARTIGHTFWRKREQPKHRYLYFLGSKSDRNKCIAHLKYPEVPYPKLNEIEIPEIERVEIINEKVCIFKETENIE